MVYLPPTPTVPTILSDEIIGVLTNEFGNPVKNASIDIALVNPLTWEYEHLETLWTNEYGIFRSQRKYNTTERIQIQITKLGYFQQEKIVFIRELTLFYDLDADKSFFDVGKISLQSRVPYEYVEEIVTVKIPKQTITIAPHEIVVLQFSYETVRRRYPTTMVIRVSDDVFKELYCIMGDGEASRYSSEQGRFEQNIAKGTILINSNVTASILLLGTTKVIQEVNTRDAPSLITALSELEGLALANQEDYPITVTVEGNLTAMTLYIHN